MFLQLALGTLQHISSYKTNKMICKTEIYRLTQVESLDTGRRVRFGRADVFLLVI